MDGTIRVYHIRTESNFVLVNKQEKTIYTVTDEAHKELLSHFYCHRSDSTDEVISKYPDYRKCEALCMCDGGTEDYKDEKIKDAVLEVLCMNTNYITDLDCFHVWDKYLAGDRDMGWFKTELARYGVKVGERGENR